MHDILISDNIKNFSQGLFKIRDNIFHLTCSDGKLLTGYLSEEISNKYKYVYTHNFLATIGESDMLSKDVGRTYTEYRLIDLII